MFPDYKILIFIVLLVINSDLLIIFIGVIIFPERFIYKYTYNYKVSGNYYSNFYFFQNPAG